MVLGFGFDTEGLDPDGVDSGPDARNPTVHGCNSRAIVVYRRGRSDTSRMVNT